MLYQAPLHALMLITLNTQKVTIHPMYIIVLPASRLAKTMAATNLGHQSKSEQTTRPWAVAQTQRPGNLKFRLFQTKSIVQIGRPLKGAQNVWPHASGYLVQTRFAI